jgi:hypothetical protein
MHSKENYYCRVCGLKQEDPPWGENGNTPSFTICDCCGVEFGYEDRTEQSIKMYRKRWINEGAKWFKPQRKPKNWNLKDQLEQIPKKYR